MPSPRKQEPTAAELLAEMIEQHRPVAMRDPFADPSFRQLHVHCAACDGSRWHVWRPGDPLVECHYWREAVRLGAVEPADPVVMTGSDPARRP